MTREIERSHVNSTPTVASRIGDFNRAGIEPFGLPFQPVETEVRRFAEPAMLRVHHA